MRLGAKAALGLLLILTTILGLSATRLTLSAQERMLGDFRNYAIHVTNVAEAGLDNAMVSRDPSETNSVLQAVHGREHIADVLILDPSGEVKYATDADQVGRVFTVADPACSICHDAGNQNTRQTVILPDTGSGRILRVATTLKNRPQCQPCHESATLGLLISDLSLADTDLAVTAESAELLRLGFLTALAAILAAVGFVHLLIVKPIRHFVGVTRAVGKGDFSQRVGLPGKDEIGLLSTTFDQMVQRVAAKTKELKALNAVATATGQSLRLEEVLRQALATVCEVTGADWGVIHLPEDATGTMRPAVSQGLPAETALAWAAPIGGQGFVRQVTELGEPVVWNEAAPDSSFGENLPGPRPMVAIPLLAESKVIGILTIGGPTGRHFTSDDVAMLRVMGHQVGAAVQNARLHEETARLAITDGLTGLSNRWHFYQVLEQELARMARYQSHASLIMLDIDNYKQFNDTHGHLAGDQVLQDAAHLMQGLARKVDTVARYGGEEFVVLMPQTDKAGATALAERILAAAPGAREGDDAHGLPVTFSAGVATYPEDADTSQALVHAADTALYRAKHEGKNRVCVCGEFTK